MHSHVCDLYDGPVPNSDKDMHAPTHTPFHITANFCRSMMTSYMSVEEKQTS